MGQQAILKAVEVSTSDTLIINTDGVDQTINPSQTLFPNILALWADIGDQITLTGASVQWAGGVEAAANSIPAHRCRVRITPAGDEIVDIGGTLASKFGFTGSESVGSDVFGTYIGATYSPEEMWLPQESDDGTTFVGRHSSDQNWFNENPTDMFRGSKGVDGNLSGIAYTGRKMRQAEWPWIAATNAIEKADSATTFQSARCFSKVINDARQMVLAESGSGNKYCKGVYYVENLDNYGWSEDDLPETWGDGDVDENYVFCSAGPPTVGGASGETSRRYYDVSLDLTQAVAPSWGWDIS